MAEPRARAAAAAPDFSELWRRASALSDDTHERTSTMRTGFRNSRFVEISDIVNRIAPKDVKRKACDSLLQWIGDSAVPCTQAAPKPRARRRSSRPSSVDDLLKLARQFDENMQQDRETSERLAGADAPEPQARPADAPSAGDLKGPPSSDPAEAELRALFDCSTQRVSGRLSQGSSAAASAHSQETERRQPEPEPAEGRGPCGFQAVACDDFDDDFGDDWDEDDLLDDSFALATSHTSAAKRRDVRHEAAEANSGPFTSVCEPPARPKPSALRELCPEMKTSNRSTFKLEPNPHFQTTKASAAAAAATAAATATAAAAATATAVATATATAAAQLKPKGSDLKPAAAKTPSIPIPDNTKTSVAAVSSDSQWDDDGVDDALLYQACDRIERSSQPPPPREKPAPPPAHKGNAGGGADRQSPRAFGRSNSLPGGGGEAGSYQGWGATLKGGDSKAGMSQSLPGSRLGSFNADGPLRSDAHPQPHAASSESHQPAAKRGVADSAAVSSKVFVASQNPMKCSAAEIDRKKQEALARRRLRLQSTTKQ
ncbi:ewing's tumor-associated antigen 1 homolog isoform X2 [Clinocottus analis]|uniref:ewing's tumor-associated antigen 1 homolog isoform X2 n=1 Tax=Clinocottus analis TaxID=304258 RepID=UPI0035BF11A2